MEEMPRASFWRAAEVVHCPGQSRSLPRGSLPVGRRNPWVVALGLFMRSNRVTGADLHRPRSTLPQVDTPL